MLKLNLGCGESKLEGFVNIDCEESTKPDLVQDFVKFRLPYADGTVDEIYMIHALEHIEIKYWDGFFGEVKRMLKDNGVLLLSYPEFAECSKRFLADHGGEKNFWRATLYGRQLYDSDYHVVPMHSPYIREYLETLGFYRATHKPESEDSPYNTIFVALKDPEPVRREDILVKELGLSFGDAVEHVDQLSV